VKTNIMTDLNSK